MDGVLERGGMWEPVRREGSRLSGGTWFCNPGMRSLYVYRMIDRYGKSMRRNGLPAGLHFIAQRFATARRLRGAGVGVSALRRDSVGRAPTPDLAEDADTVQFHLPEAGGERREEGS